MSAVHIMPFEILVFSNNLKIPKPKIKLNPSEETYTNRSFINAPITNTMFEAILNVTINSNMAKLSMFF